MESCKNLKNTKKFKIKRKVKYCDWGNEDIENDFQFEKEGNVVDFLGGSKNVAGPKFLDGKIVPHSVIGPTGAFVSKNEKSSAKINLKRQSSIYSKFVRKESLADPKTACLRKFHEVIDRLNEVREKESLEERKRMKNIVVHNKDTDFLSGKFFSDKNANKTTPKLHPIPSYDSLSSKMLPSINTSTRNSKLLLSTRSKNLIYEAENDNLYWYMTLRDSKERKHLNTFMRVGNEFSGLYLKISKPNPLFKESHLKEIGKFSELEITGSSKLNLEIEALQKTGYEHLCLDFLDKDSKIVDEIIEENYE